MTGAGTAVAPLGRMLLTQTWSELRIRWRIPAFSVTIVALPVLFFTFFGLDAIRKDRYGKVKVATVGNPGMHLPTWIGAIPGFSALATKMMQRQMEKIDMPPIPEFIELVADSGVHLYACKASVDMFGLTMEDFVPQVEDIISVGEFYEKAAGGEIIFT